MYAAGVPVKPDVFINPVGNVPVTLDMFRQVELNMDDAGVPAKPEVSINPVGKLPVTPDML